MRGFQEKKRWRNILQSKPVLILLAIFTLFLAWSVLGLWGKMSVTGKSKRLTENKVAELQEQKQKLSADIEKLETEAGIEENIRAQLGLAREGESVVIIVDEKAPAESDQEKGGGFLNWLKKLFQ